MAMYMHDLEENRLLLLYVNCSSVPGSFLARLHICIRISVVGSGCVPCESYRVSVLTTRGADSEQPTTCGDIQ